LALRKRKNLERTKKVKSKGNGQWRVVRFMGNCLHLLGFEEEGTAEVVHQRCYGEINIRTVCIPMERWQ